MNSIWNGFNKSGIHLNSNNINLIKNVTINQIYSSTILLYKNQTLLNNDIIKTKITNIILTFLVSFMSLMTIFGNILVIIAFIRESTIRTYSNYFILNLSIADLLIGLIWYVYKIKIDF